MQNDFFQAENETHLHNLNKKRTELQKELNQVQDELTAVMRECFSCPLNESGTFHLCRSLWGRYYIYKQALPLASSGKNPVQEMFPIELDHLEHVLATMRRVEHHEKESHLRTQP